MKITEDVRKYAAEQKISENEALGTWLETESERLRQSWRSLSEGVATKNADCSPQLSRLSRQRRICNRMMTGTLKRRAMEEF
jgi:hypothetical protein